MLAAERFSEKFEITKKRRTEKDSVCYLGGAPSKALETSRNVPKWLSNFPEVRAELFRDISRSFLPKVV